MMGELEYDDLVTPLNEKANITDGTFELEEENVGAMFPVAAQLVSALFVLLFSIIIMNLLFGLAVADIQELYKTARVHQLIQQVTLISYLEGVFESISDILPEKFIFYIKKRFQGMRTEGRYKVIRSYQGDKLPNDIIASLHDHASELHARENACNSTEERMQKMEASLEQINKTMGELSQTVLLLKENILFQPLKKKPSERRLLKRNSSMDLINVTKVVKE